MQKIWTFSNFARFSSISNSLRFYPPKSLIQRAARTTMAAENAAVEQFNPENVEINPRCYPLAERADIVENYHGVQVSF